MRRTSRQPPPITTRGDIEMLDSSAPAIPSFGEGMEVSLYADNRIELNVMALQRPLKERVPKECFG
jgi:hypothetical protein